MKKYDHSFEFPGRVFEFPGRIVLDVLLLLSFRSLFEGSGSFFVACGSFFGCPGRFWRFQVGVWSFRGLSRLLELTGFMFEDMDRVLELLHCLLKFLGRFSVYRRGIHREN
jgi:hypothetical protein